MSIITNPDDYIIKKRRKKYKFALFGNSPICFEFEEWIKRPIDVVELGAGTGLFSVELAMRHPDTQFLAVDVKADRLQKGALLAQEKGLENIWFLRARANQLGDIIPAHSLSSIWSTFADPFPKKGSAGRRMTHPSFLKLYAKLLKKGGVFYLKHDNSIFFDWSVEQLEAEKWDISTISTDLHASDLADDYKILTTYEARWLGEGLKTNFAKASPKSAK
jgi:tRNA (guanine-N7-)-methyltransferase